MAPTRTPYAYESYTPFTHPNDDSVTRSSTLITSKPQHSIFGPTKSPQHRAIFLAIILFMTFCGANNDFLGKLCYQSLPGEYSGYEELQNRYWISWLLTFGTFFICSFALCCGWNEGREFQQMRDEPAVFLCNVSIPATCDVFVNLGRYVGLVFLPASVVTV